MCIYTLPPTPMFKTKIPFHEREIIYTLDEARRTSGMSESTFFKYRKEESITVPTSKSHITNWVRRLGFPRIPIPYGRDNTHLIKDAQRLRKEGMSAQAIADLFKLHFTTIHRYIKRSV